MDCIERKDGSILFPQATDVQAPRGYEKIGRRLFKLTAQPRPCQWRRVTPCPNGKCERWWCFMEGEAPINPGVCARCQSLVGTFTTING